MRPSQPSRILTVSELTLRIRERLEQTFSDVWVEGEICNLRAPSSGHVYLGLKDSGSQIRAVLFRTSAQRLRFALREGLCVIARGRLTVYEPRGEYQIVLEYVEPNGIGARQLALEQLKEKLAAEGLFDQARKRPLPFLPRRVGVVTSLSGAALRDILAVLERRCPLMGVVVCPVPVQGDGAAPQIAAGVRALGASQLVDVMIVGRGGGSLEDLWCFNEEVVVRAVAACPIPVISAVGHEIDVTLADFAADYRAPTPSAAAEAVAPVVEVLVRRLRDLWWRQEQGMRRRVASIHQRIQSQYGMLPALRTRLERKAQRLDDVTGRLDRAVGESLREYRGGLTTQEYRLAVINPVARIRRALAVLPQLTKRLEQRISAVLARSRAGIRAVAEQMQSLSPLAILARGYGIVQGPDGRILRRADEVSPGEVVRARLAEGQLRCRVEEIVSELSPLTDQGPGV